MELDSHTGKPPLHKRGRCCCCVVTTSVILVTLIILTLVTLIILIFTIFQPKNPTIQLLSTTLTGISPRVTFPALRIELNLTLATTLSVRNPNYASFKHDRGSSQLYYRGDQIGEAVTSPGNIGARRSETMEARLIVEADKVNVTSVVSDVLGGEMSFEVRSRVPGRATVLGFVKKHVVAVSVCQIDVGVPGMDVLRQVCQHKTQL